jgi:(2Fe-2S) ferredoxin
MPRFKHHVFVCVNERSAEDPRGCCGARGGMDIRGWFSEELEARGLKRDIRANKAGCLDLCARGPVVVVYPDAVWYSPRSREDVCKIVEQHLVGGEPVAALIIPRTQ